MGDGKCFVRICPVCSLRHQTADQTGETPCSPKCVAKAARRKKGEPEPAPPPEPEPVVDDDDLDELDELGADPASPE